MKQLLLYTLLGLAFVVGIASIVATVRPHTSQPSEQNTLMKEVP